MIKARKYQLNNLRETLNNLDFVYYTAVTNGTTEAKLNKFENNQENYDLFDLGSQFLVAIPHFEGNIISFTRSLQGGNAQGRDIEAIGNLAHQWWKQQ